MTSVHWLAAVLVAGSVVLASWPELAVRVPHLLATIGTSAGYTGILVFAAIWLAPLYAAVLVAIASPLTIRVAFSGLFVASSTFVTAYRSIMSEPLEVMQFERTMQAARAASEAFSQFSGSILAASLLAAPMAVTVLWPRSKARQERVTP